MKLKKIYFDAYKSLLNKELEINQDCLGFVGTNESGKSNILYAVNLLSEDRHLQISDTPKMDKSKQPTLRFELELDDSEFKELNTIINEWRGKNTIEISEIFFSKKIIYNVKLDREPNEEERYFEFIDFKVKENALYLKANKIDDRYKLLVNDKFINITNAIIVNKNIIEEDNNLALYKKLIKLKEKLSQENKSLEEIIGEPQTSEGKENSTTNTNSKELNLVSTKIEIEKAKIDESKLLIRNKQEDIKRLQVEIDALETKINEFNISKIIDEQNNKIDDLNNKIITYENESEKNLGKISQVQKITPQNDATKNDLTLLNKKIQEIKVAIEKLRSDKIQVESFLKIIEEPLIEKYSDDIEEVYYHLDEIIDPFLKKHLPKVVFWEYNNKYILKSETLFTDITEKNNSNEVSRPLINIFMIGLGAKSFDDIKRKIAEIQRDSNERSRFAKILNTRINEYIKKVWGDYDQNINITLEKDQIRIEFFDPKNEENAGYYNMEERSQGCQSFLSFLLTVGAEAKQGVIKNTVLLLDEPETHLHPSGARFMLQELIKISENNNIVLFATHSIFLIDRNNLNRHIILKKEKEKTIILPANVGRIGYLMQEEVLYKALDVNINNDFSSDKENNFVFEGDGDVFLFEYYYEKVLAKDNNRPFPLDKTIFYQGGKCSDIKKYFTNKQIPIDTKWIFILDNDNPANDLKKFLEGKYPDQKDKIINISQYNINDSDKKVIEFEDLLPKQVIKKTYLKTAERHNINLIEEYLTKSSNSGLTYYEFNENILTEFVESRKQSEFKSTFKEMLNKNIKDEINNISSDEDFKKKFETYYNWVTPVIENLKVKKSKANVNINNKDKESLTTGSKPENLY